MRYHVLGHTGMFVSELCLGTMTFGASESFWAVMGGLSQKDAEPLVGQALDAGINFIDTADVYSEGAAERVLGQALKNLKVARESVVVATKVYGETGKGPNGRGATRRHILEGVKASLARLQLDYIDLYQIHGFDAATPIEETVRALDQIVRDGLVRYVGVSNWAAWQIANALGISARWGLSRFESLQAYYSVAGRDLERELLPMLSSEGLGLLVWSPLAGGLLSGKYPDVAKTGEAGAAGAGAGSSEAGGRRSTFDFPPVDKARAAACIDVMRPIAAAHGVSVARVALAWLLQQPRVTSVIIGAKRADQLADNIAATEVTLSPTELAAIGAVSALPSEYPGWMIDMQGKARRDQIEASGRGGGGA